MSAVIAPLTSAAPLICGLIGLYATIRIVCEKNTLKKLPHLNVMNFAIAASIALLVNHWLALIVAVAYFVGSTLETNAIASAWSGGLKDD